MSPVRKDIIKIKDTNSTRSHSTSSIDFSDSEREKEDVDGSELGSRGSLFKAKGINIEKPVSNRAKSFTFRELSTATRNFKATNLIGEGGFGKVYKGRLHSGQIVAIKQLNLNGHQGNYEFIVEILMLSFLRHPNLVNLIGYCVDRDERLLVYEYMQKGSLDNQLFDPNAEKGPLDWNTRIKIAVGAAKGIEYLHGKVNPPVIFRDLKSSNILLDNDFNPKLSDFGLAKLGPSGDKTHVSTRVMGTYGYCAPEYAMTGKLSVKSDIYSFGVVLLELITGRKVLNYCKARGVQNLVSWARPFLKDQRRFVELVDPQLQGRYSVRCLNHAVAIIAMCLQEQPHFRPLMSDVVEALEYLENQPYYPEPRTRRSRSPHRHYLQNRVGA